MNIAPLTNFPIVETDRTITQQTRNFFNALARLSILEGSGSPEGVQEGKVTRLYMDTDGTSGSILYIKQVDSLSDDSKKGWILV